MKGSPGSATIKERGPTSAPKLEEEDRKNLKPPNVDIQGVPKNMLHFKILIKTQFFSYFMRSYTKVHMKICIKGHIIIIHGITCF